MSPSCIRRLELLPFVLHVWLWQHLPSLLIVRPLYVRTINLPVLWSTRRTMSACLISLCRCDLISSHMPVSALAFNVPLSHMRCPFVSFLSTGAHVLIVDFVPRIVQRPAAVRDLACLTYMFSYLLAINRFSLLSRIDNLCDIRSCSHFLITFPIVVMSDRRLELISPSPYLIDTSGCDSFRPFCDAKFPSISLSALAVYVYRALCYTDLSWYSVYVLLRIPCVFYIILRPLRVIRMFQPNNPSSAMLMRGFRPSCLWSHPRSFSPTLVVCCLFCADSLFLLCDLNLLFANS